MKPRLRRGWSLLRVVFALAVVGLVAVLLYEPLYAVLYPTHYAKSKARPPKWRRGKIRLSNSCDLLPERAPATELRNLSRIYVFAQSPATKLVLATILRSEGSCDALQTKRVVFVGSTEELPHSVAPDELLVVFFEHPIDAHLAAVAAKQSEGVIADCSCGQFLLVGDKKGFRRCYEELLNIKHCQHVFQLPGEEGAVVRRWLSLVHGDEAKDRLGGAATPSSDSLRDSSARHGSLAAEATTASTPSFDSSDRLLVLDDSRLSISTRVLKRLVPEYFSQAEVVYQIPGRREQLASFNYRPLANMIARDMYDNSAVLEFYDRVMRRRFWAAVEAAGYSTDRNMYCY